MRSRVPFTAVAALVGFALGLSVSMLSSSERWPKARFALEADSVPILPPLSALHREPLGKAAHRAKFYLDADRPWAAWLALEPYLGSADATAPFLLLAARAAAGWGGWDEVSSVLTGQDWLGHVSDGEGWFLLAEAHERSGRWADAVTAYRNYLSIPTANRGTLAQARLAPALMRIEESAEAAIHYRTVAAARPEIADWLRVLELEAWLAADSRGATRLGGAAPAGSVAVRLRRARVEAALLLAAGDSIRATVRLVDEIRILGQQGAIAEAAELTLELFHLQVALDRTSDARENLRALAWEGSLPSSLRVRAADLLGTQPRLLTHSEELARSAAYEAAGRPAQAARALRAALSAQEQVDATARLRVGRLLFEAGDFAAARESVRLAAEGLTDPERSGEAALIAARARFRGGDPSGGLAELREITERRRGTSAAGTANFLLADASPTVEAAIPLYRRAADVTHAPEAREALERLADRLERTGALPAALRAWEDYVRRYPTGERTSRQAFQAGLLAERAGQPAQASRMFSASMAADPLSYYALRSGEHLGRDPLDDVLAVARPWIGLAIDPLEAGAALVRLDQLHELGLTTEWQAELEAIIRRLERRPAAAIALGEGLRDRGHSVEAIRLSRRLLAVRDGQWDDRLLRIAFPLPFREMLVSEAQKHGVDPMLFAGLIHQESAFRPAVRSRVGATGLSQIMPATGRWLAPRVGIPASNYQDRLLTVPEINLSMGALFLHDLLRRYNGAADLALAGYNAGPARADRWRSDLGYDRDIDAFREAIPFNETRHYVRIVLRNAHVYDRLYRPASGRGEPRGVSEAVTAE